MDQVIPLNSQARALFRVRSLIEAIRSRMPRPPRFEKDDLILILLHIPLVGYVIAQDFPGF